MLRVHVPAVVTSPAAPLLTWLPHALANAAPELTDRLNATLGGYTLEMLDTRAWVCRASAARAHIEVSTRVLEVLWAQAYGLWVFYQRMLADTVPDGSTAPITDPAVVEALALYRWALQQLAPGCDEPWPETAPRPAASPAYASDVHVTQELTLLAAAFLLLHEVAHVALGHSPTGDPAVALAQEQEADAWAADWVLVDGRPGDPEAQKRALGVALALLLPVSRGIHTGQAGGPTHPRHFDRLYHALAHRVPPHLDHAWAVVVAALSLHFTNKGLAVPRGPFEDHRTAADAFFDALAARA